MGLHCDSACGLQIGSPDVSVLTQDRCDSLVSPRDPTRVQQFCLSGVPWFPIPWDMSSNSLAFTMSSQSTAQDKRSGSG